MQGTKRRLAAILVADIAGFSRLVGLDEEGTLSTLRSYRLEIIDPLIAQFGGHIANTAGDSYLLDFPSVVDATRFALAMQQGIADRNKAIPEDRQIHFRIGINLGDVIADGEDLLGEGVNIAARLEALCEPGGVMITDDGYRQVRDRLNVTFRDGGVHRVKNITRPIQIWFWNEQGRASSALIESMEGQNRPSIAALPFENMSDDPEQEFFSDGITEDIITDLSRFPWLKVIARNSSFSYKGQNVDLRRVAEDLSVRYVLEGSVRKAGNRVRVTAQLIDAQDGSHLWAERYDRTLDDMLELQDEITHAIVTAIAPQMQQVEIARAERRAPADLDCWGLVVRANHALTGLDVEGTREAKELAEQALNLDPNDVLALVVDTFAHLQSIHVGISDDPRKSVLKAREQSKRALELDGDHTQAHVAYGTVCFESGDHAGAYRHFRLAIASNHNDFQSRLMLAITLVFDGQYEEGLREVEEALHLSPRDPWLGAAHAAQSFASFQMGGYEAAVDFANQALEIMPFNAAQYWILAASYQRLGNEVAAQEAVDWLLKLQGAFTLTWLAGRRHYSARVDLSDLLSALRSLGLPD